MHTPGHTSDSMTLLLNDRILTGDTLLIGAPVEPICRAATPISCTTRLFNGLLRLDPELLVYPGA